MHFPSALSASLLLVSIALPLSAQSPAPAPAAHAPRRNVIIFVADGLRRGSVNQRDMPTFFRVRTDGVDFANSHSSFPTFTTANASVIATGHAIGDTGDFSNVIYPGAFLAPMSMPGGVTGTVTPFLESDEVLADLNSLFNGNYLGEPTLLSFAREHGYNVASVGKLGPAAIQQVDALQWDRNTYAGTDAIILDDQTGTSKGVPLPHGLADALRAADLAPAAPTRNNGYADDSLFNNGNAGNPSASGTKLANINQQRWFADATTRVLLPRFADAGKPFVLLFWSRDPDGTQHNNGDSYISSDAHYGLAPGINGETVRKALHNADNNLRQLLDWLDAHPAIKANTDVLLTSDHGFATISRREIDAHGHLSDSPSRTTEAESLAGDHPERAGTLPSGFIAMDLALSTDARLFDAAVSGVTGDSVFSEVLLRGVSPRQHLSNGSALVGMPGGKPVRKLDGSDAQIIVAANGGSDLLYIPSGDPAIVARTVAILTTYDYVSGLWVDNKFCPTDTSCPGALPLSDIDLDGATRLPKPTIVVNFKVFYPAPDLQSAIQIADTTLQEGQGNHGGFGRDSTWNNMAAIGPDFRQHFVDNAPVGNIDIVPTLAAILGLDLPSAGRLRGRIASEAFTTGSAAPHATTPPPIVSAPAKNGRRTVEEFQMLNNQRYADRGCMIEAKERPSCPGHF